MAKFTNKNLEDLDITREELKKIGDAFKDKEFRKLFADYVDEINDPANKAIYEKEMTQLERERGYDITFIHPQPGYVIKTSQNGVQKAFINVCSNEKIGKPSSARSQDRPGLNWSIPYSQAPPKVDLDKDKTTCVIYDVIFHPDTLYLAHKSKQFQDLVNDTAISAVEDNFKVTLDRCNVKFPKLKFKGLQQPCVVRKKCDEPSNIPSTKDNIPQLDVLNIPYPSVVEPSEPRKTQPRSRPAKDTYTIPSYIIKHRKGIEMQEYTESVDSKIHAATPSELVVEIDLPLIKSTKDSALDILERKLSFINEKPKYKLEIDLPYEVNQEDGTASFDSSKRKLIVTLPVKRKKFTPFDFMREDSGIDSDANHLFSSSEEDVSDPHSQASIEEISSDDCVPVTVNDQSQSSTSDYRTSDDESPIKFLNPDLHYSFPPYLVEPLENGLSFTLQVKNIDPSSVQFLAGEEGQSAHICFTSMGSGFFPLHYAFCVQFAHVSLVPGSLSVEQWDNHLIAQMNLMSIEGPKEVVSCLVGKDCQSLTELTFDTPLSVADVIKKVEELSLNEEDVVCPIPEDAPKPPKPPLIKSRTLSETSGHSPLPLNQGMRGILKKSRSLSESHTDEFWMSVDSMDDNCFHGKKSVRFSDVISKKVFRANSSILGQKKKNERKLKNKRKAQERRASESEVSETEHESVSEVSDVSDVSDISSDISESDDGTKPEQPLPSSKNHRRRGHKNKRKNASAAKYNYALKSDYYD